MDRTLKQMSGIGDTPTQNLLRQYVQAEKRLAQSVIDRNRVIADRIIENAKNGNGTVTSALPMDRESKSG